jgi:hypothetical protein
MSFGKRKRFYTPDFKGSPGPAAYMRPASADGNYADTIGVPLYRGAPAKKPTHFNVIANPSVDRTAWLVGNHTRHGTPYYATQASNIGPAGYKPKIYAQYKRQPQNKFSKNRRFGLMTNVAENKDNLCTFSPGPIYYPKRSVKELGSSKKYVVPWSFGPPSRKSRAEFIHGSLVDGYLHNSCPSTMERGINVSPAEYNVSEKLTKRNQTRQKFKKANRFYQVSIGKKVSKGLYGHESPGPIYHVKDDFTIGYKQSRNTTSKWK